MVALFLLGGRQVALAIIMHDTSHRSLFANSTFNDWAGQWLAAYPILQNMHMYRPYHLNHHRYTGTDQDPDLPLANKFPIPANVLIRNVIRDFSGTIGIKSLIGSLLMALGYIHYELNGRANKVKPTPSAAQLFKNFKDNLLGPIFFHCLMLLALWLVDHPWLYSLWWIAYITTYMAALRLRSMAEHALCSEPNNALRNARTTKARWWNRLLHSPHNVHYHLEHHMLMAAPYDKLPLIHQKLRKRGAYDQDALYAKSYASIIKDVTQI